MNNKDNGTPIEDPRFAEFQKQRGFVARMGAHLPPSDIERAYADLRDDRPFVSAEDAADLQAMFDLPSAGVW